MQFIRKEGLKEFLVVLLMEAAMGSKKDCVLAIMAYLRCNLCRK